MRSRLWCLVEYVSATILASVKWVSVFSVNACVLEVIPQCEKWRFSSVLCPSSSDFLVPDYLNQEQEETLGQYELGEHGFESNSSVQMPVISQVSSTQNCESTFPLGSLGGLAEKEEDVPEQPKTNATAEAAAGDPPKPELSSITIE